MGAIDLIKKYQFTSATARSVEERTIALAVAL